MDYFWEALHKSFNLAQDCYIEPKLLEEIPNKEFIKWFSFSKEELINTIEKCNNSSNSGLDKLSWKHLKKIIKDEECISKFIDIANICIDLYHWLLHFKILTTIIISKLNKTSYDLPKSYYPLYCSIWPANCLRKWLEKDCNSYQFQAILSIHIN